MQVVMRTGAVGGKTTLQRKRLPTPSKARAFVQREIRRRLEQGWVEVQAPAVELSVDLTPGVELRRGQHVIGWRREPKAGRLPARARAPLEQAVGRHRLVTEQTAAAVLKSPLAAVLSGRAHPLAPEVTSALVPLAELVDLQIEDLGLARTVLAWLVGLSIWPHRRGLVVAMGGAREVLPERHGPWTRLRERARTASDDEHQAAVEAVEQFLASGHPQLGPADVQQRAAAAFVLPTAGFGERIAPDDLEHLSRSWLLLLASLGDADAALAILQVAPTWAPRPPTWCLPTLLDRLGTDALPVFVRLHELGPSPQTLQMIGQIRSIDAAAWLGGQMGGSDAGVVEDLLRARPSFAIAGLLRRRVRAGSPARALLEALVQAHGDALERLSAALPADLAGRLERWRREPDAEDSWELEACQEVAAGTALPVWLRVPRLAPVLHEDGRPLTPASTRSLLLGLARDGGVRAHDAVASLGGQARTTSLGLLAVSLLERWEHEGGLAAEGVWTLMAFGALANDEAVRWLEEAVRRWSSTHPKMATRAVDALAAVPGEVGHLMLLELVRRGSPSIRRRAEGYLHQRRDDLGKHEAALLAMPRLGLDEGGRRVLRAGDRTVELSVSDQLELRVVVDGRPARGFPRRRRSDDPVSHAAAKSVAAGLRGDLKRLARVALAILEGAMVDRAAWRMETLVRLLAHPLLAHMLRSLVWADDAGTLRFDEGGLPVDVDSDPRPTSGAVRLVHVVDLSAEVRRAWNEHLSDYELKQAIAQLGRPVRDLSALRGLRDVSLGRVLGLVRPGGGWTAVRELSGGFHVVQRRFGELHVGFAIEPAYMPGQVVQDEMVSVAQVGWAREPIREMMMGRSRWGRVDPLIVSEVALALGG